MATISQVLNFDVATIQGRSLTEGSIYCTEAPSVQLLFNIVWQVKDKWGQPFTLMHVTNCFHELKYDLQ